MTKNLTHVCVFLICLLFASTPSSSAQAARTYAIPASMTTAFSPTGWSHLATICEHLQHTQMLSVTDMNYAAHLLRTPPPINMPRAHEQRQMVVLSQLTADRPLVLTPVQRRRLFDVVRPYADSPYVVVRENAMIVLTSSHDPRAVVVLKRHAHTDPDTGNRRMAAYFLRRLRSRLSQPIQ